MSTPAAAAALLVLPATLGVWAGRLRRLRDSVDRHRQAWAAGPRTYRPGPPAGSEEPDEPPLRLVALGDSAAQGIGANSPDRGYVALLAQRLADDRGRDVEVLNLSVSGARMHDVTAEQVPRLRSLHGRVDAVTVDVGGNDLRRYDPAGYRRDVATLLQALADAARDTDLQGRVVVADIPYFMHGRFERDADDAARQLREQAAARGLAVAPLHEAMRGRGTRGMFTDYAADWFHPGNRGHAVWAAAFWPQLDRTMPGA